MLFKELIVGDMFREKNPDKTYSNFMKLETNCYINLDSGEIYQATKLYNKLHGETECDYITNYKIKVSPNNTEYCFNILTDKRFKNNVYINVINNKVRYRICVETGKPNEKRGTVYVCDNLLINFDIFDAIEEYEIKVD